MNIKAGLKVWSINKNFLNKVNILFNNKEISYVEIYIIPGTIKAVSSILKKLQLPVVIHAPHFDHGFNLQDLSNIDKNTAYLKESIRAADITKALYIIMHPGFNGTIENIKNFLEKVNDKRIILENMTQVGIYGDRNLLSAPQEMREIMALTKKSFCLDFGHAYKSAYSLNKLPRAKNPRHSRSLNKDPKSLIKEFMGLEPKMFHLSDGHRHMEKDEHLNLGEGNFDLSFCKECIIKSDSKMVTIEVSKKDGLNNDLRNIRFLKNL